MRERIGGEAFDLSARLQNAEIRAHGDASESEDGARLENFQIALEVGTAVVELGRQRLIVGRGAAGGRRDIRVFEREAVVAANGGGLARKSSLVERLI